jgi:excisionase family DNA binding protein
MNSQPNQIEDDFSTQPNIEQIASEVALLLNRQIGPKDVVKLLQIVFLEVDEAAALLRVEPKTIRAWVSQDRIPYRKANGRVLFLLHELLTWTLPENDKHSRHRLAAASQVKIASSRLAATWERKR